MRNAAQSAMLVAGLVVLALSAPRAVTAQTVAQTAAGALAPASTSKGTAVQKIARQTPQCMHIITECKKLGFVPGQWKTDNGVWKDCFDPVVLGKGTPTRSGQPITVPVNPSDVQACHAAVAGKA
jgi:hypothetical protein